MANPTTPKQKIIADVLSELEANAETTGAWPYDASVDNAFSYLRVVYHVELATIDVVTAALLSKDYPSRSNFMSLTAALTYQATLPEYVGLPGSVYVAHDGATYELAFPDSQFVVEVLHRAGVTVDRGYFHITDDNVIIFSGQVAARAKVNLGTVDFTDVANESFYTTFPADLISAVTVRALEQLYTKGGNYLEYAKWFGVQYAEALADIRRAVEPSPMRPYQRGSS